MVTCGGCGNSDPNARCIGCLFDFGEQLCKDEGCPHYGTPHVCISKPAPIINRIARDDVEFFKREMNGSNYHEFDIMNLYQSIATKSAIYPGQGTPLGLAYVALKGCGEAGEFAEHVGKAMRDDSLMEGDGFGGDNSLTETRRTALIKEIGDQLWYLAAKCNELGITLSEAALTNLEKLCDRTERDALRGSGDDR